VKLLAGKVALVTGAASGIGRAVALRLAGEGALVVATDAADEVAATAEAITAAGGRAQSAVMDITDRAQIDAVLAELRADESAPHVLVNCAGWDRMQPFVENSPELWDKVIEINLKGPVACCRAVLDDMIAAGGGKIISIGSDAGRVGSTGETVYAGCKGGIIAFSKSLAREVAGQIDYTELADAVADEVERRMR